MQYSKRKCIAKGQIYLEGGATPPLPVFILQNLAPGDMMLSLRVFLLLVTFQSV
jgi:hypothetical protein